jgi:hypothetical protein
MKILPLTSVLCLLTSVCFGQGARPPVTTLSGLSDVFISSPAGGQMLTWNAGTSKWNNGAVPVPTLAGLGDVAVVSATSNQVLKWDSVSSKWVNYGPLHFSDVIGSVAPAQLLSTTGAPSSSTYYRGDGTWGAAGASGTVVTVATLPASPTTGQFAAVTDGAASLAWGATVTGGGSTTYLVWWNGTNWTVTGK